MSVYLQLVEAQVLERPELTWNPIYMRDLACFGGLFWTIFWNLNFFISVGSCGKKNALLNLGSVRCFGHRHK